MGELANHHHQNISQPANTMCNCATQHVWVRVGIDSTRGGSTSVRGRVRSPHMAKLQAASVPIARAAERLELRQTDGRVAVLFNAPYGRGA